MKKPTIKTDEEIKNLRKGGKILAETLNLVLSKAVPGISTLELDEIAENYIRSKGALPAFKGYNGFPKTLCTAINEVIVHGIPEKNEILKEGDLFTADCGVFFQGMNTDAARSKGIGKISQEKQKLLDTAKLALKKAIEIAVPNTPVNEIGKTIENIIKKAGFYVIKNLTGHGIGKNLHEPPEVLNYYSKKNKTILLPGMTIAIEPIFSATTEKMQTLKDKWTLVTIDGSPSVQEENTILITKTGNEILTEL